MARNVAPLGEFIDLGKIAFETFRMQTDKQGMILTKFGRKSVRAISRIVVSLPFVYYRHALSKLQEAGKLPENMADLELNDIIEQVDPDYAEN